MARNKQGKQPVKRPGTDVPATPPKQQRVRQEEIFPGAIKVERSDFYSGPLPTPQAFSEYDQALPGAAERILSMAEREQTHRHAIESGLLRMESRNSGLGLLAGFILGLIGLLGGIYMVSQGADLAGAGVAFTALVSLVTVFVVGRKQDGGNDPDSKKRNG